jgi:hypothetical protein
VLTEVIGLLEVVPLTVELAEKDTEAVEDVVAVCETVAELVIEDVTEVVGLLEVIPLTVELAETDTEAVEDVVAVCEAVPE